MHRVLIAAAFACVLVAPIARGQSLPTKKEAQKLVEQTVARMNLMAAGGSPFHFVADAHFEIGGNSFDGTYELLWTAPDRYREEFRMGAIGETDVALGDKIYILRTTPTLSLPVNRVRAYVDMTVPSKLAQPRRVLSIRLANGNGPSHFCVRTESGDYDENFCFDAASREIVSLDAPPRDDYWWKRSEFVSLGECRYPGHVVHHDQGETLEMRVKMLQQVTAFSESVLTPPPGAIVRDWCSNPKKSGKWADPESPKLSATNTNIAPQYYVLVGRDGRAEKSAPVVSGTASIDAVVERWIQSAKFAVSRCGDKPIEYEEIIVPNITATHR
jgi:hypothetical protein